jgi:enamine deaminase RidA (YjgF/YER057c/UK114 family)
MALMTTPVATHIDIPALEALLPAPPLPLGSYVATTQVGTLLYTSGVLPMRDGKIAYTGALGVWDTTIATGQEAARLSIVNALSLIRHTLDGDLSRLIRIVKLTGFVSSAPGFYEQPAVINGASDFLLAHFGEAGRHVRSAVGVASLPGDASVEIELIVEVK